MVDKLSRGMKQRLSLARTLAHDPQVLILDEPASGLDPAARIEIRELMKELANMGKTIFFSTHILPDVENICSHVGIVEAGKMVMQGTLDELKLRFQPHRELVVTVKDNETAEKVRSIVLGLPDVVNVEIIEPKSGRSRVRIDFVGDDDGVAAINQSISAGGVAVMGFNEEVKDLESVFMKVTKGIVS
jgi:ABC-2 type transport system ATP-binding protein